MAYPFDDEGFVSHEWDEVDDGSDVEPLDSDLEDDQEWDSWCYEEDEDEDEADDDWDDSIDGE